MGILEGGGSKTGISMNFFHMLPYDWGSPKKRYGSELPSPYLRLLFLRSLRKPTTDVFKLHFPSYIYLSIDQNPGYFVDIGDEMLPSYIRGF